MNTEELKSIIEDVLAGMNAETAAPAAEAPAEAPAEEAADGYTLRRRWP